MKQHTPRAPSYRRVESDRFEVAGNLLDAAIQACYAYASAQSPKGGNKWLEAFDNEIKRQGLTYTNNLPCTCPDAGEYGHYPECGLTFKATQ